MSSLSHDSNLVHHHQQRFHVFDEHVVHVAWWDTKLRWNPVTSDGLTCVCVCVSAVILDDFVYTVTVSGQKVFVVKRQHNQQEPISV